MKKELKNIEIQMLKEIAELGFSDIRIDEFNRHGRTVKSKNYCKAIYAVRKMIGFANGYFPIYQGSEMTNSGHKYKISLN